MTSAAVAIFGVFLIVGTMTFFIGAMYLGGGSAAIRRQVPQLGFLTAALVAAVFAVPLLKSTLGDLAWGVVLLAVNAVIVVAFVRQRRRTRGPVVAVRPRATRMRAFRILVLVWVAALAAGAALLILAVNAGY